MSFISAASCFFRLVEYNLDLNKFFEEEQNALTRSSEPVGDLRLTRSIGTDGAFESGQRRLTDGAFVMESNDGRSRLNEMKDKVKEEEDEYMMCTIACKYGQLECLQVLHKNGFRWNDLAANLAASYGRLDCLRYLHENGYVLNMDARAAAYANNRQECLQYLIDHGCPWIEGYISVMFDLFI